MNELNASSRRASRQPRAESQIPRPLDLVTIRENQIRGAIRRSSPLPAFFFPFPRAPPYHLVILQTHAYAMSGTRRNRATLMALAGVLFTDRRGVGAFLAPTTLCRRYACTPTVEVCGRRPSFPLGIRGSTPVSPQRGSPTLYSSYIKSLRVAPR